MIRGFLLTLIAETTTASRPQVATAATTMIGRLRAATTAVRRQVIGVRQIAALTADQTIAGNISEVTY